VGVGRLLPNFNAGKVMVGGGGVQLEFYFGANCHSR